MCRYYLDPTLLPEDDEDEAERRAVIDPAELLREAEEQANVEEVHMNFWMNFWPRLIRHMSPTSYYTLKQLFTGTHWQCCLYLLMDLLNCSMKMSFVM